jgi:periplasmic protein TonB
MNKLFLSILFLFLFDLTPYAQSEEEIITFFQCEATFPGGNQELQKFIINKLSEADITIENIEDSKLIISFYVEIDGSVSEIKCFNSKNDEIFPQFVNQLKSMPKWIPACDNNKEPIRQHVRFPIRICLK